MVAQDIIVIGASSGGVTALQQLVSALPADLPAAIFAVLHIGENRSLLPEILARAGPLAALHAIDGQKIERGKIYVAPSDCHLLIEPESMRLSHGPKENRTRPAINPLFRSAAFAFGPRVAAVILTGNLDDGTAGMAEVKRRGGVAVVQNPDTALYPSMPRNAIKYVDVDYVVGLDEIPDLLVSLATGKKKEPKFMKEEPLEKVLSGLTCPECRGPLWEERQGRIVEYRCRVGHAYSPLALAEEHDETVERTLWSTLVALEESADISEKLASDHGGSFADEFRRKRDQIEVLKKMLNEQKHQRRSDSY